ncbi:2-phosphosulfolactate phosphatase [Nocardioides sp. LHG3406-4]|uniref:2-phosphosulfolactate phosphatase n=1 Tax=Nocardioides sp. LHG3406-4 TaxID=2804575 RepID=UPI003CF5AF6B
MTHPAHTQSDHRVRLEWGPVGALAVAGGADIAVVVDVLSFTTTLTVAVERGIAVHPYPWQDGGAEAYAAQRRATLAVGRFEAAGRADRITLSPASLEQVTGVERLVLPSPNGSTIAFLLAESGARVAGACLRNAPAVAAWVRPYVDDGARVAVVPAGERWPDGSLRPAVEDLWGAGAVLAALDQDDILSPEARVAAAAFRAVEQVLSSELAGCASGAELAGAGFAEDVRFAGEYAVSPVVPVLEGDAFVAAS